MSDHRTETKGILRREFLKDAGLIISGPALSSAALPVCAAVGPAEQDKEAEAARGKVVLEVLNPMGIIDPPPPLGISPRIPTLAGKKFALIHNNKPGAKTFLDAMQELLTAKYPGASFLRYDTNINLADKPEKYAEMARSCDVFILGSGD